MKQLSYGGDTWLIGDDAADALLDYAVVLGSRSSADSVEIAVLDSTGRPEQLTLLLGPATMMTAETSHSNENEPDNREAIAEIARRSRTAVPSRPITSATNAVPGYIDDF